MDRVVAVKAQPVQLAVCMDKTVSEMGKKPLTFWLFAKEALRKDKTLSNIATTC